MSSESPFPHLAPQTISVLAKGKQERINYLYTTRWIPYPRAKELLEMMTGILNRPRSPRAECKLIVSSSNNGKSSVANKFIKANPATHDSATGVTRVPAVYIPTLTGPEVIEFYREILKQVSVPYRESDKAPALLARVRGVIDDLDIRMLLLDEFNVVITKSGNKTREFLTHLRALSVYQQLSIICFTTKEGVIATQYDEAFQNRFKIESLPEWHVGQEWLTVLAKFEGFIPLPEPSNLSAGSFPAILLDACEGRLGELRDLLVALAEFAIDKDKKRLLESHLVDIGWVKPSLRRMAVEKLRG